MTVLTSAGCGLLDRLAASRTAMNPATDRGRTGLRGYSAFDEAAAASAASSPPTRLTLGGGAAAASPAYEVAGGTLVVSRADARHARI